MTSESEARLAARHRRSQGSTSDFDGERLALARRLARQSRSALARAVELTPAAITQFEQGSARPSLPVLAGLSLTLGVPRDFFRYGRPVITVVASSAHFRSLRSTPALSRDQALAFASLALEVLGVVEQYADLPKPSLPALDLPIDLTPEGIAEAARASRTAMGMPTGPAGHVVRLLESHGTLVLRLPPNVDSAVDAFSTVVAGRPIVLMSPLKDDRARSRFDAAHELGHLVLHHDVEPGNKVVEAQAHSFAAEFLMPAEEIVEDLPRRVDWEKLHAAKRRWGTSLKALVYRAHSLGVISELSYRRANRELAAAGYPEAGPLGPPESPMLLGAAVTLLVEHGVTIQHIADAARLSVGHVLQVVSSASDVRPSVTIENF